MCQKLLDSVCCISALYMQNSILNFDLPFQFNKDPDSEEPNINLKQLCRELGNVTIVHKGVNDIISDGDKGKSYSAALSSNKNVFEIMWFYFLFFLCFQEILRHLNISRNQDD